MKIVALPGYMGVDTAYKITTPGGTLILFGDEALELITLLSEVLNERKETDARD